jgi:hypothetical protein
MGMGSLGIKDVSSRHFGFSVKQRWVKETIAKHSGNGLPAGRLYLSEKREGEWVSRTGREELVLQTGCDSKSSSISRSDKQLGCPGCGTSKGPGIVVFGRLADEWQDDDVRMQRKVSNLR